jgi:phosphomannomutase/phosphoglucomutase
VLPAYKAWVLSEAGGGRPLRVAVDAGNGAYSEIGPDVIEGIPGVTVDRLFCTPDGSFPNRDPNCAVPENLGALRRRVRETGADVGIAFDGDGDRVAFADETGEVVAADEMLVLLMRWIGPRVRGEKVVYDLKCSQVIAREAERLGATALMERSGHAFIKRRMIQERAVLGGEVSGHYFYRELGGGDDGLFSAVRVLRLLQEGRSSLGELRKALPPRFITSDIRIPFPVEESGELMDRLRLAFPPERRSELDGIRISFPHGWGLLRRSITEPKLTLRFEGDSAAALTRIIRENKPSGTPVAWIRAG